VLNASSVTYLNLALLFGRAPQQLGIVAIDGVPLSFMTAAPIAPAIPGRPHRRAAGLDASSSSSPARPQACRACS
jgi:hypothetical protein